MTMHHCVATTGQILDMVGPYRVSGEPTVLYFIWFHVDGVKLWDTTLFHLYVAGGRFMVWIVALSQCAPLVAI